MTGQLAGKIALITGAGDGIGRACALQLAAHGAVIAAADRDPTAAEATAALVRALPPAEDKRAARAFGVDLAAAGAIADLVDQVVDALGGVDILVNASSEAGRTRDVLEDDDDADWARMQLVNLTIPRRLIRAAGRRMVAQGRGGRIVSISSSSASRAVGTRLAYGVAKAGLEALTRIAAAQLAKHDINVNAVAPGVTATPLQKGLRDEAGMQAAVSAGPLENFFHRVSTPDDVAAAVAFLVLPGSRQVTGQVIHTSAGVVV
ncbi:MAG: SDR family oxidoreductase [Rhodospirillaceae bacterium]|nr:SDR family oxidoreductase [Rhodospirillaceae bacterium]